MTHVDLRDIMLRTLLADDHGETMDLGQYTDAFSDEFRLSAPLFRKLEARQRFSEPRSASWRAFNDGRLDDALLMHEARRGELTGSHLNNIAFGFRNQRVRLLTTTLTPYMLWELPLLRLRDELGMHTSIVNLDTHDLGRPDDWPEVIILGTRALYKILYDADGYQTGGIRHTDPDLIARCSEVLDELYVTGEPIQTYYEREVAHLLP